MMMGFLHRLYEKLLKKIIKKEKKNTRKTYLVTVIFSPERVSTSVEPLGMSSALTTEPRTCLRRTFFRAAGSASRPCRASAGT